MANPRITLATLLLLAGGLPIWICLAVVVPASTGWGGSEFRFVAAPLALCGVTVAIHRLVRHRQSAWALSAVLAGVIVLGSLSVIAWWKHSN